MWLKILLLSLILTFTSATTNLTKDVSTYLKEQLHINSPTGNISAITNYINSALKSLNLSDIEVNIILNRIEDNTEILSDSIQFENSIKYLFQTTLNTNWQMKYILQELALSVNNLSVHEILYEILWQKLKKDGNKTNPFSYIELYRDVEYVLHNFNTSDKLNRLYNDIQKQLIICSAQLLQSYFIQNSTLHMLLKELKGINNLYEITIPYVFENLNTIEHKWLISEDLMDFELETREAVYNHITYIKYLQSLNVDIPQTLYKNLETLIARPDLINISLNQRQLYAKILPTSMASLLAAEKICLRNTTNFYIFECPQTYLLCTNLIANNVSPINRKKAAFKIERLGNNQYGLRSPFWGRYFHLQINTLKNSSNQTNTNNSSTVSQITKNLYSHAEMSPWLIHFRGNYAAIQDAEENFYVCGGNSNYWANGEKYIYTRPSKDFYKNLNECLWLLEDCSDVI